MPLSLGNSQHYTGLHRDTKTARLMSSEPSRSIRDGATVAVAPVVSPAARLALPAEGIAFDYVLDAQLLQDIHDLGAVVHAVRNEMGDHASYRQFTLAARSQAP